MWSNMNVGGVFTSLSYFDLTIHFPAGLSTAAI